MTAEAVYVDPAVCSVATTHCQAPPICGILGRRYSGFAMNPWYNPR